MPTIKAKIQGHAKSSYNIFIEKNAVEELVKFLKKGIGQKYAIITDDTTAKLFGKSLQSRLKKEGIPSEIISFKPGEKNKTLKTIEELAEKMVKKQFTRKDAILALGGGIVGDTAGFLAAIYLRGIPYIHIPTTLLAMVDSCIGGKTGVDLKEGGKNLIGSFNQPAGVFIDTDYLKTLAEKQIRSGLAEVIKYGVISDEKLFKFIAQNLEKIFKLDAKTINHLIKRSVEIKLKVVESDEKESGKRMLLNYGHTYGHALEKLSNYTLLHGYAISIGMVIANDMAVEKKLLKSSDAEKIKKLFKAANLPTTTMKKPKISDLLSDKKRDGDFINFVLPTKIGKAIIHKEKVL